jgi:hypothetical protein
MDPQWIAAGVAAATVVAGVAAWCARWAWRILMRTTRFLDDYFGEPARPGVAERPGVMARIGAVEKSVAKVLAETQPNDGHSMRDLMQRTAHDVSDVKTDLAALRARTEVLEHQREDRDK